MIEEIESPSRRKFLNGLLGAGVVASIPFESAFAQRRKRISDEARNRIWKNYPEMQGAIDLINDNVDDGLIMYAMWPVQEYYDPRGVPTSIDKIPREDMDTPQYWLLLKIWNNSYNSTFEGERFLDGSNAGIPTLSFDDNKGVWYFARGLKSGSSTNESDLLKALYIGATGSPDGAEPIINGTFMDVPGVREKVREWREEFNFAPHSDEGNHLLAYNLNILRNADFRDKELVELSLGLLGNFFRDVNLSEKERIYGEYIVTDLMRRDKLADYHISYPETNTISFPLGVRITN